MGADLWDDEFRVRLESQLWSLALELLTMGQSVILELGHWAREERDEKRLAAQALGTRVEMYYIDAPLATLVERAENRNLAKDWRGAPITRAHMEAWARLFEPPDENERLLYDQSIIPE